MPFTNQDLRSAGLKVTLPRVKILQILEDSDQSTR
ncbi:MAG: ferric iron uptake transcriptional regulator, partial [Pseudomonadota bacterium]